ncbi:hypothetical protein M514_00040 [Trichuris suis]|uniref:Uncharacterized protein n=1 Tax=Trichuris suis TaxID=68888 RepID=A0A085NTV2_9BILA|nr:hypothetical protein M514_00040 [Trichuris suis]
MCGRLSFFGEVNIASCVHGIKMTVKQERTNLLMFNAINIHIHATELIAEVPAKFGREEELASSKT